MRYFRGTKDQYEKETEEAERLVRPAPKVKPPRHDRRRETIQDDDLTSDVKSDLTNDLSLNYKGSYFRPTADLHRVKVKNKDTGSVYEVSRETLKEHGDDYEVVQNDEDELEPDDRKLVEFTKEVLNHVQKDPNFGVALIKAQDPNGEWADVPDSTPLSQFSDLRRHKELLERFPTLGDLRAYETPQWVADQIEKEEKAEKVKKPRSKGKPKSEITPEHPPIENPPGEPIQEDTPKEAPEPKKEAPPSETKEDPSPPAEQPTPEAKPEEPPVETKREETAPPKEEKPVKKAPKSKPMRQVSPEEVDRAKMALIENFPVDVSRKLMGLNLHPDDVADLVHSYTLVRAEPLSVNEAKKLVEGGYELNPNKVKPPRYGVTDSGQEVPFDELSPTEQAEATKKHALRSIALSLAARQSVMDHLGSKSDAPEALLGQLADFSLKTEKQPPAERMNLAQKAAKSIFHDTVASGTLETNQDAERWGGEPSDDPPARPTKDMSPHQVKRLLSELDSEGQQIAVGFLQARDYLKAWDRFLGSSSAETINEHQSPRQIWSGIQRAEAFFEEQEERYPPELRWMGNPAGSFRNRVLSKIRTLAPQKYKALEETHQKHEDKEFERRSKEWEKLFADDSSYREQGFIPPPQPKAPLGYATRNTGSKDQVSLRDQLLDEHRRQSGRELVARFLTNSSYPNGVSMGETKKAVYHGVAPYPKGHEGFEPYQKWTQAHQRDYGPKDAEALLKSAREWLETPVLTHGTEGIVRDTQLRAALDLAIRTHKDGAYSAGVHPAEYNRLLAKLAGVSPDETLLTVQAAVKHACANGCSKGCHNSLYAPEIGETMKPSSELRKLAAKYASVAPELSYSLMSLSDRVAQDEEKQEEAPQQAKEAQEQAPAQESKQEEPKEDKTASSAYSTLRSRVIRLAHANPNLKEAYLPLLQTIKDLG